MATPEKPPIEQIDNGLVDRWYEEITQAAKRMGFPHGYEQHITVRLFIYCLQRIARLEEQLEKYQREE